MSRSNVIPLPTNAASLASHKLADCFPLMGTDDYKRLRESIAKGWINGFPIVIYEGQILDGRNRYRALKDASRTDILNSPNTYEEFPGSFDEAKTFVTSTNLARRNLSPKERRVIAEKLANCMDGQHSSANLRSVEKTSIKQAAKMMGVAPRSVETVRQFKKLKADGILKPDEIDRVENGDKPHSWAVKNAGKRIADAKKPKTGPRAKSQHAAAVRVFRKAIIETEASCVSLVERVKVPNLTPEERLFAISALEKARLSIGRLIKTLRGG